MLVRKKNDNIVIISGDVRENERRVRERFSDCGDVHNDSPCATQEAGQSQFHLAFPAPFFKHPQIHCGRA